MELLDAIQIASMCREGKASGLADGAVRTAAEKLSKAGAHGSHEDVVEEMLRRSLVPTN